MIVLNAVRNKRIDPERLTDIILTYVSDKFNGNIVVDREDVYKELVSRHTGLLVELATTVDDAQDSVIRDSIYVGTRNIKNFNSMFDTYVSRYQMLDVKLDE